ncbi:MAG: hypothetical protein WC890_04025 [Candidatus Margulisiibacteriota bacterium]
MSYFKKAFAFALLSILILFSCSFADSIFPIRIEKIPSIFVSNSSTLSDMGTIQPANFDPQVNRAYSERTIIKFSKLYSVYIYAFSEASSFDYVIELKKNNRRLALYRNILDYAFSPDKNYLYLAGYQPLNQQSTDKVAFIAQIINLKTMKVVKLENYDFASASVVWSGDYLLTYPAEQPTDPQYFSQIGIFNKDGKVQHLLEAKLNWGAASVDFVYNQFGVLPADPSTFYLCLYDYALEDVVGDSGFCSLYLQKLVPPYEKRTIPLMATKERGSFPKMQFDFKGFSLSSPQLKFTVAGEKNWRTAR